jgi:hypothetical protein
MHRSAQGCINHAIKLQFFQQAANFHINEPRILAAMTQSGLDSCFGDYFDL